MTETDLRPEPEALLAEAERAGRGRLKIFLGAAPGVGKTYAMLEAARRHRADGMDVLAAVIETHGRAETEAMLRDLPLLPRRPIYYKGRILSEMDVDGLIARRPKLALIDELAHTNAPESRHEKRWQDVEEVLAAGIDVYTTLNIQHIETLNDTVTRITGVRVRETVPDHVFAAADEIELVDLPPEELLTRLREGKVYVQDQAARAVQNFFAKGNLTALRELAMRAAADQVDAQLREHMAANAIAGPWPAQERILVCINESPAARDAIRVAKRSADRARAEWIALSVTSTKAEGLSDDEKDRVAAALRLAERLGAELATLDAEHDVAQEILEFARRRNVRRIVLGRPRATRWLERLSRENVSRDLLRKGADFEITVTSEQDEKGSRDPSFRPNLRLPSDLRPYGAALVGVALATGASAAVETLFPVASLSLIYMTAVVAVAALYGLGPAIASAAMGFLAYNFLFTEPRLSFHVTRQGEFLTLILFLAASILTGNLAARLRSRVIAQRAIVDRTNKLYDFSRRVAVAANFDDVVWAAVSHVASTLECQSILLVPDASAKLAIAGGFPPEDKLDPRDMSAASYAWDKGEPAGRGSGTLPTAHWLFLPVRTADLRLGVMGVAYEDDRSLAPGDRRLLEALIDQVALAIARIRLTEDLEATRLASETERLRTALLNSVSHDLRTPLVTIIGAAGSLVEPGQGLTEAGRTALAETIRDEGERLDRYVQNLLDMTRLGHGALKPNLVACDVADLIGSARQRLRGQLQDHKVQIDLPDHMPAVRADPILTEQVIVNILDNAAKYAPDGTRIATSARVDAGCAILSVADEGPGIPPGAHDRVFDMFYRASAGDRERAGTGLGLAICKGLIEAQGGTIRAEPVHADGTGTRIVIRLPLDSPQ
jgi:two-component system, OmpR family, sensor histidine kinase KdpD